MHFSGRSIRSEYCSTVSVNRQRERRHLMLLTATIQPDPRVPNLQVRSALDRQRDYLETLHWATSSTTSLFDGVVFAENSGADLSPLRTVLSSVKPVEFLSLPPSTKPEAGRAYLETQLVLDAFDRSESLRDTSATVWKLTGRYQIRNASAIAAHSPADTQLYFNLRRIPRRFADMQFYGIGPGGVAPLAEILPSLLELGPAPEVELYNTLMRLRARGMPISVRFSHEPDLVGTRGFNGVPYGTGRDGLRRRVAAMAHRAFPPLWL